MVFTNQYITCGVICTETPYGNYTCERVRASPPAQWITADQQGTSHNLTQPHAILKRTPLENTKVEEEKKLHAGLFERIWVHVYRWKCHHNTPATNEKHISKNCVFCNQTAHSTMTWWLKTLHTCRETRPTHKPKCTVLSAHIVDALVWNAPWNNFTAAWSSTDCPYGVHRNIIERQKWSNQSSSQCAHQCLPKCVAQARHETFHGASHSERKCLEKCHQRSQLPSARSTVRAPCGAQRTRIFGHLTSHAEGRPCRSVRQRMICSKNETNALRSNTNWKTARIERVNWWDTSFSCARHPLWWTIVTSPWASNLDQ